MFLTIILVHFGVVAFLIFWGSLLPDSIVLNFLLSQGILIIPTIIFLLIFERRERPPVPQTGTFMSPVFGYFAAGEESQRKNPAWGLKLD